MAISTKRLAEHYTNEIGVGKRTETRLILWQLLIESLSPDEHMVYQFIDLMEEKRATSPMIATQFEMSIKWASMILNKLWRYHLLDREQVIDERGKYFVYRRCS